MNKKTKIQKDFGKKLRELRLSKGITSQMDLGLKSGLDRTYIGGIERGERNVSLNNIEKLSKALDVSPSELLKL